jgi:carbon-monoxide dehydrogenase catalytic subunit
LRQEPSCALAIDNYPNRKDRRTSRPRAKSWSPVSLTSTSAICRAACIAAPSVPLNDAVIAGRIRGLAAVVGCNNARVTQDSAITKIVRELIANDVLVVVTGCAATGAAKDGYLRPEFMDKAGPGLREVCEAIGVPPVLHVGSCVDNSRILTILTQCATEGGLGEDISTTCPPWASARSICREKALSIGTYCAASGAHVLFGIH